MMPARRDFMKDVLTAGLLLPGLSPAVAAAAEALQQSGAAAAFPDVDQAAYEFWTDFLTKRGVPGARGSATGVEREVFFFHDGSQGLHAAMDLRPADLVPTGDVTVSLNVVAFKPSDADRNNFERIQNAQLRLDLAQDKPILELVDTMVWTAIAALHPDRTKKLPPLQNLAFDPGATWQKMQNIPLPGGQGLWAVNLFGQRKESFFSQLMRTITKEVDRFAPVLGLPGISTTALQSFNAFYGLCQSGVEYLLKSNPVPVFATSSAMQAGIASRSLPLRSGTYVLVPVEHAQSLGSDRLAAYELRQGYIVPKKTDSTDVWAVAAKELSDVTYATIDVNVKPVTTPACKK
jgi:hypothetical protein